MSKTASSIAELASWVSLGEADNQLTYVSFGKSVEIEAGFEAGFVFDHPGTEPRST